MKKSVRGDGSAPFSRQRNATLNEPKGRSKVTIEERKTQNEITVNDYATTPQFSAEMRETTAQLNFCSRCGNARPPTHRVRSDLLTQLVCEVCAAEVPLDNRGVGALTLEQLPSIRKSSAGLAWGTISNDSEYDIVVRRDT